MFFLATCTVVVFLALVIGLVASQKPSKQDRNRALLKDLLAEFGLDVPEELKGAIIKSVRSK